MIRWLRSLFTPSVEIGGGNTRCRVEGVEYRRLYQVISLMPGVALPREPRYFWTGSGVYAEFVWKGHTFQIEGDLWDASLWIIPKDGQSHPDEIREILEHLERHVLHKG